MARRGRKATLKFLSCVCTCGFVSYHLLSHPFLSWCFFFFFCLSRACSWVYINRLNQQKKLENISSMQLCSFSICLKLYRLSLYIRVISLYPMEINHSIFLSIFARVTTVLWPVVSLQNCCIHSLTFDDVTEHRQKITVQLQLLLFLPDLSLFKRKHTF